MKLEDIGFYTLSDARAIQCSMFSPLWRCELILTDRCNFACPYCRGLKANLRGDISFDDAKRTCDIWIRERLMNVRFSGGEPTLWPGLCELVRYCRDGGVKRIAISTNGSAPLLTYDALLSAGVNDFSISLDACCAEDGDKMTGGHKGSWDRVVSSVRYLSKRSYTTVGMVFTDENIGSCVESVLFADSLGVSDIRVVPSAQFNRALELLWELPLDVLARHPILRYRVKNGGVVRGMRPKDCGKCRLALDDMAVAGGWHFPCIIYMREGGAPIGRVGCDIRLTRAAWVEKHDAHADPICSSMCLDVCMAYNNKTSGAF